MPDITAAGNDAESLKARLAAWIRKVGIKDTPYGPELTAEKVIAANDPANVEKWMAENSRYLAARCRLIRDDEDLTPRQALAEAGYGGHVAGNARRAA